MHRIVHVAFEPNPTPRSVLENLISLNGIDSFASVVPEAVGAATGRQVLYIPTDGTRGLDGLSRLDSPAKVARKTPARPRYRIRNASRLVAALVVPFVGSEAFTAQGDSAY